MPRPARDRASEDAQAEAALAEFQAGPQDGLFRQRELTEAEQDELVVRLGASAAAVDAVLDLQADDGTA